jgi:hypothetical protein
MLRVLPLVALAALPVAVAVAVAAPVPPGTRVEFGTNGLLARADLDKVKFDSRPVRQGERGFEEAPEREPEAEAVRRDDPARPKNRYDVAVHMPWTKYRAGEPVPAYFVLRNNRGDPLGLDARLALSGPEPTTWNSCGIDVRDAKTGKPVYVTSRTGWACGGGALVEVPADGFYCVKGDLGRTAAGTPLPPGEYEVAWRYRALQSAPVTFTVHAADGKPTAAARRPAYRFYRLRPGRDDAEDSPRSPVVRRACDLGGVFHEELSAALAVGEGTLVPDVHAIPAADRLVEARVEWKPYRDGDRVAVTLRAVPPHARVTFAEVPHLHLQIEVPDAAHAERAVEEKAADPKRRETTALVTPLTVEARLPVDWRDRARLSGAARVAVLVTAAEVELPHGGARQQRTVDVRQAPGADAPPVWAGVVRTEFTELRFPQNEKGKR